MVETFQVEPKKSTARGSPLSIAHGSLREMARGGVIEGCRPTLTGSSLFPFCFIFCSSPAVEGRLQRYERANAPGASNISDLSAMLLCHIIHARVDCVTSVMHNNGNCYQGLMRRHWMYPA